MNRKQFISMLDSSCIINVFLKLCLKRFKGYFEGMLLDYLYCILNKVKNFIRRSVCFLTFSPYMKNRKNLYSEVLNRPVSGERRYFSCSWKFCNSVIIFFNCFKHTILQAKVSKPWSKIYSHSNQNCKYS